MTEKELEQVNIKIAKKMGWNKFRLERTPEPLNTRRMTAISPGNFRHQFVPAFTNNLAYALQLVDWAVERGISFQLSRNSLSYNGAYHAAFYTGKEDAIEIATLPSIAICLAFLKIQGEK
jgi:hypothetical protein